MDYRSYVFSTAHKVYKAGLVDTWSQALRYAWDSYRVFLHIRDTPGTEIEYIKAEDGSLRTATTNGAILRHAGVITYMDVQKDGWRQFRITNLRSVA